MLFVNTDRQLLHIMPSAGAVRVHQIGTLLHRLIHSFIMTAIDALG